VLRNGCLHKGIRFEEGEIRLYDEHGTLIKSFSADRVKELDLMLHELFDWVIAATLGAVLENPSILVMLVVLAFHEPGFFPAVRNRWGTFLLFKPHFMKTRKRPKETPKTIRGRLRTLHENHLKKIPEGASLEELQAMIYPLFDEIEAELRAYTADTARFLAVVAQKSEGQSLRDLVARLVPRVRDFVDPRNQTVMDQPATQSN
jgi:hypothetical protein